MDASLKKGLLRVKSSGISSGGASLFFLWDVSVENSEHILALFGDVLTVAMLLHTGLPQHSDTYASAVGKMLWDVCTSGQPAVRFPFIGLLFREMRSCVACISKRKPIFLVCPTHRDACVLSILGAMTAWQSNVVFSEKYF